MYIIGLIFIFFSFFLDWYSFQILDINQNILVSWKYNIFFEWSTPIITEIALNIAYRPEDISVPWIINLFIIIALIFSGYIVLFKNVEKAKSTKDLTSLMYINGFLLFLVLFYLLIFPLMYLIPKNLYFPLLYIEDLNTNFVYFYSIGIGYLFHMISFPLIFPYTLFYFSTVSQFERESTTPENIVRNIINKTQELLDLDKFIAQEELKCKFKASNPDDSINSIFNTFIGGIDEI